MVIKIDFTDLNLRILQGMVVFQYYPSFITNALVMYNMQGKGYQNQELPRVKSHKMMHSPQITVSMATRNLLQI